MRVLYCYVSLLKEDVKTATKRYGGVQLLQYGVYLGVGWAVAFQAYGVYSGSVRFDLVIKKRQPTAAGKEASKHSDRHGTGVHIHSRS